MKMNLAFKSLESRRMSTSRNNVNINNNSTLTEVNGKEDRMTVSFVFTTRYEPNIGQVRIEGDVFVKDEAENIEKALKKWRETDGVSLPTKLSEQIHNTILTNCIIEASMLARDVKLPTPFPTPHIKFGQEKADTSYIR